MPGFIPGFFSFIGCFIRRVSFAVNHQLPCTVVVPGKLVPFFLWLGDGVFAGKLLAACAVKEQPGFKFLIDFSCAGLFRLFEPVVQRDRIYIWHPLCKQHGFPAAIHNVRLIVRQLILYVLVEAPSGAVCLGIPFRAVFPGISCPGQPEGGHVCRVFFPCPECPLVCKENDAIGGILRIPAVCVIFHSQRIRRPFCKQFDGPVIRCSQV